MIYDKLISDFDTEIYDVFCKYNTKMPEGNQMILIEYLQEIVIDLLMKSEYNEEEG